MPRQVPASTSRRALVALIFTVLATALAGIAPATAAEPARAPGHDISHPQCGGGLPEGSRFGIVGLNQGRPFTTNPCLADQYRWATGRPAAPAIYVNTANPAPRSDFYWPRSGSREPVLCRDAGSTTDAGCAYNYGWQAAEGSMRVARTLGKGVLGHTWWLDVETMNTWNGDGVANTAVLQGMYDHLRAHGVGTVGLYSTGYQWKKITGGYTAGTAPRYLAAWKGVIKPDFPLHDAPLWVATGKGGKDVSSRCGTSFTGGPTTMVQFIGKDGFDTNVTC